MTPDEMKSAPKAGKHDFFKLLVFDCIIRKVLDQVPLDRLTVLMEEMMPASETERLQRVTRHINDNADIAVLLEVPSTLLPNVDNFWMVHAKRLDSALNTILLARRSLFDCPDSLDF